jgi:uncharacterized membrane protein YdbT with pleckstrin-like domain
MTKKTRKKSVKQAKPTKLKVSKVETTPDAEDSKLELKPVWRSYWGWIIFSLLFVMPSMGMSLITFPIIWLRIKMDKYTITDERLIIKHGLIARKIEEIELFRIKDVMMNQGMIDRILGIGSVKILSVDDTTPALWIRRISNPMSAKETLRKMYRNARKKEGVVSNEFINHMK